MLRIALNGRFTGTPQPTGTQVASFQLFNAIMREPGDTEFILFADSRFPGSEEWKNLERVTFIETPFQDWSRARSQLWEQLQAPRLAVRYKCKIMHHPMTTSPIWQNGIQNIVTMHDLNFLLHPEWYSRSFRMVYDICALPGLQRCSRVVSISEYVKHQAAEVLKIPASRLSMIHNGVKPMHAGAPWSGNYLFAAGSLQPHKNLSRLIQSYRMIGPFYPGLELVIAGRPQPRFASQPDLADLLATQGVRLTGYLSDEELANAYAGARLFCYPSLEEGFGLPILEAMTLGTPVLTSNVSCLPEIAGPATQVDPTSLEAIAGGMRHLLDLSPSSRESLKAQGRAWASLFSWRAAAVSYLSLYDQLAR